MGGHVDATLGVRTGRLWVVLTISPHKYVLSGACVCSANKRIAVVFEQSRGTD